MVSLQYRCKAFIAALIFAPRFHRRRFYHSNCALSFVFLLFFFLHLPRCICQQQTNKKRRLITCWSKADWKQHFLFSAISFLALSQYFWSLKKDKKANLISLWAFIVCVVVFAPTRWNYHGANALQTRCVNWSTAWQHPSTVWMLDLSMTGNNYSICIHTGDQYECETIS